MERWQKNVIEKLENALEDAKETRETSAKIDLRIYEMIKLIELLDPFKEIKTYPSKVPLFRWHDHKTQKKEK